MKNEKFIFQRYYQRTTLPYAVAPFHPEMPGSIPGFAYAPDSCSPAYGATQSVFLNMKLSEYARPVNPLTVTETPVFSMQ